MGLGGFTFIVSVAFPMSPLFSVEMRREERGVRIEKQKFQEVESQGEARRDGDVEIMETRFVVEVVV